MGFSLTPTGGGVGFVDSSLAPMWEVDLLIFLFAALAFLHAIWEKEKALWISCLVGGLAMEQACIWGAGTHCHHSGIVDVSVCSSGNSVLVYAPLAYSAIIGGRRMSNGVISQAMWTGLLTGLLFWPYEMQGPFLHLWKWANEDGVVMPKSVMGEFQSLANDATRGFVTHPQAFKDLSIKAWEFPIHAPMYDMAYGVGIGASMGLLPSFPYMFHTVLLGPVLGILYIRFPILIASVLDISVLVSDPCVMVLTAVLALLMTDGISHKADPLLVSGPLIFQLYWGIMVLRRSMLLPGEVKCIVLSVTVAGIWIWSSLGKEYFGRRANTGASKKTDGKKA